MLSRANFSEQTSGLKKAGRVLLRALDWLRHLRSSSRSGGLGGSTSLRRQAGRVGLTRPTFGSIFSGYVLKKLGVVTLLATLVFVPTLGLAQLPPMNFIGGGGGPPGDTGVGSLVRIEGGGLIDEDTVRTARETLTHSTGTPEWSNRGGFEKDVFTFTRVVFKNALRNSAGFDGRRVMFDGALGVGPRFGWWVDFPDADLNFSYRLQQMTSIRTDPDGRVIKLGDPALTDYPLIYMEHPGYMALRDDEVTALRKYLRNGGVLFVNDFWSGPEWDGFAAEMKRVLPGEGWVDLPLEHPVFNCVFHLSGPMHKLQVPTMQFWNQAHDPDNPGSPPLQRVSRSVGSEDMHVRAWLDDKQRIRVIAIHNSDVSDGWEREGENPEYFHTFSEKISYPLGINIIFYVMTH